MKDRVSSFLRWSQKYTRTDMAYVIKGGFWLTFSRAAVSTVSFLTMVVFAHFLSKENYGTYQFVVSGLGLFSIFTLSGINTSLVKSIAQRKEGSFRPAVKEKMKWGLIGTFLSLGLAGWYFLHGNNLLTMAFLMVAIFVPFKETFSVFAAFWTGRKKFDPQAKYQAISATLSAIVLIPTIYLTDNVIVIVAVFLAGHTFFDWLFYRKTISQLSNDEQDPTTISFGKNLTLMNALSTAAGYLDKIIVWQFLGAAPVAIYTFAQLPIQKITNLLPISVLSLPKLSENKIDKKRKKGIISKFLWLSIFTISAAMVLALIAPFLYKLIFPRYIESIKYFQALSALIALSPFLLLNATLIAEMKEKALYIINTGVPLIKIILFFIFIPHFEIWGIIVAILISEILRGLLTLHFFLKI